MSDATDLYPTLTRRKLLRAVEHRRVVMDDIYELTDAGWDVLDGGAR